MNSLKFLSRSAPIRVGLLYPLLPRLLYLYRGSIWSNSKGFMGRWPSRDCIVAAWKTEFLILVFSGDGPALFLHPCLMQVMKEVLSVVTRIVPSIARSSHLIALFREIDNSTGIFETRVRVRFVWVLLLMDRATVELNVSYSVPCRQLVEDVLKRL